MRKITVLKVLAIEIVNLMLLKEETGVDYVVTIDMLLYSCILIFVLTYNVAAMEYRIVLSMLMQ
jgi:hypothetical protein